MQDTKKVAGELLVELEKKGVTFERFQREFYRKF